MIFATTFSNGSPSFSYIAMKKNGSMIVTIRMAATYELPYERAKEMLLVENVDSREYLAGLFNAMYDELPVHKANNKKKSLNNLYTFQ